MAVKNTLTQRKTEIFQNAQTAVYEAGGQKVELTPEVIREYMVSGDKEKVTIQEIVMFMNLCKFSGLNPWAKEAYCIKYGNDPATMVVAKEAYVKRAEADENFDGFEAGIVVLSKEDHEIIHRPGSFKLPDEEIIGGYAKVYRKDRSHPYEVEVSFDEYAARKRDGSLNSMWSKKPGTMVRKVALVQALREAFPSSFGGAFTEEEGEYIPEAGGEAIPQQIARQSTQRIEQHEAGSQAQAGQAVIQRPPQDADGQEFFS